MLVDGAYIRTLRENLGMSARDLSRAASISKPHLSQIENGHRNPSPGMAARLAAALQVSISDLRGVYK